MNTRQLIARATLFAHLILGLLALAGLLPLPAALVCAGCVQLVALASARQVGICYTAPALTAEQVEEFKQILAACQQFKTLVPGLKDLGDAEGGLAALKALPAAFKEQNETILKLQTSLDTIQKANLRARSQRVRAARAGEIDEEMARQLAGVFILHCAKSGKLEALASQSSTRDFLLGEARAALNITGKAAITTSDIPLPVEYGGQITELISQFGIVRSRMSRYPIGMGTAKPARMGTRPAFGSIAMSAGIDEKNPTISFASLESHKLGGLVRLPREIDEQSIVPIGQFLARYGAVEFARAEDTWGFLADGTSTYESVKGVVQICRENSKTVVLSSGKTKVSDATIDNFRALRRKVNKAALSGRLSAYYLDTTWETVLRSFNTQADPQIYVRNSDGSATLDAYPIVWTDVLTPYSEVATPDAPIACFGALSFYWFGEHGTPRLDTSEHVFFANDQLATRFIEEIDIDYNAVDSMATLLTPAS